MIRLSNRALEQYQRKILSWYQTHKRDLPWRNTHDPYKILVSEVMSQQTQITRVVEKYLIWMEMFPDIFALAKAPSRKILKCWSGLGYNRRALFLHACAKQIVSKYHGVFPDKKEILMQMPGIGEYTASAILCFAFRKQVPVIDTNIRKVIIIDFFAGSIPSKKEIEKIAERIMPEGRAYEWNQALMDYASVVLKKEKVPIPKQSKFSGSDRYYRGRILKVLLEQDWISEGEIAAICSQIGEERRMGIVSSLVKDGLLLKKKNKFYLPE